MEMAEEEAEERAEAIEAEFADEFAVEFEEVSTSEKMRKMSEIFKASHLLLTSSMGSGLEQGAV